MKELSLEEAALAWAQGKRVEAEALGATERVWGLIHPLGTASGYWNPNVFGGLACGCRFRLAPELPAKKWRPWTPEEVPVGVKMRERECTGWFTPTCAGDGEIEIVVDGKIQKVKLTELADNHEHSLDGGKTWLPCGVEVDA